MFLKSVTDLASRHDAARNELIYIYIVYVFGNNLGNQGQFSIRDMALQSSKNKISVRGPT